MKRIEVAVHAFGDQVEPFGARIRLVAVGLIVFGTFGLRLRPRRPGVHAPDHAVASGSNHVIDLSVARTGAPTTSPGRTGLGVQFWPPSTVR